MPRDVRDQCAWFRARPRFTLGRRSPRGLLHNQYGVSGGTTAFSDVTEGKERKQLNRYFEGLCTFLLLRFELINNPGRFKDDAWTVIWFFFLSLGSELDMRGDHFSIFGEFRSVCRIWMNSYGTIYRDRKNHLRLSSLDYPPRRKEKRFNEDSKENAKDDFSEA
ncbi:hypothetical protein YC2023_076190 [Brassica napus]